MNSTAHNLLGLTLFTVTTTALGAQEWVLESSLVNPVGPTYAAAAAVPNGPGVVLFDGINGTGQTFEWADGSWVDLAPANSPSARFGHAMAQEGNVFLFGGVDSASSALLNDTWSFDGQDWLQVGLTGPVPPARWGHAMAGIAMAGLGESAIIMFGGTDASGVLLNDTWLWDGAVWEEIGGDGPMPRRLHAMCEDPSAALSVLMHGGSDLANNTMADAWRFSLVPTRGWSLLAAVAPPGPLATHSLTLDSARNQAVLLGGKASIAAPSSGSGTWVFDGAWTAVTTTGNQPVSNTLHAHAAAFDNATAEIVAVSLDGSTRTYGSVAADRPTFTSLNAGCSAILRPNPSASPGFAFIGNDLVLECQLGAVAGPNVFGMLVLNDENNSSGIACGQLTTAGGQYRLAPTPPGSTTFGFAVQVPNSPSTIGDLYYAEAMTMSVALGVPVQVSNTVQFTLGGL